MLTRAFTRRHAEILRIDSTTRRAICYFPDAPCTLPSRCSWISRLGVGMRSGPLCPWCMGDGWFVGRDDKCRGLFACRAFTGDVVEYDAPGLPRSGGQHPA